MNMKNVILEPEILRKKDILIYLETIVLKSISVQVKELSMWTKATIQAHTSRCIKNFRILSSLDYIEKIMDQHVSEGNYLVLYDDDILVAINNFGVLY